MPYPDTILPAPSPYAGSASVVFNTSGFKGARVERGAGAAGRGVGQGGKGQPCAGGEPRCPSCKPAELHLGIESLQRGHREDPSEGRGISLLCNERQNKAPSAAASSTGYTPSLQPCVSGEKPPPPFTGAAGYAERSSQETGMPLFVCTNS